MFQIHEMVSVIEENGTYNPPMIVDEIRVIEIHTPAFFWRWKTPKKQHLGMLWKKWKQRMTLYISILRTHYPSLQLSFREVKIRIIQIYEKKSTFANK